MGKYSYILVLVLTAISCKSIDLQTNYGLLTEYSTSFKCTNGIYYVQMNIPDGNLPIVNLDPLIKTFQYENGSIIYLSQTTNTPNYEYIASLGDSISDLRFETIALEYMINVSLNMQPHIPDTIVLSGIDSAGNYWQDIRLQFMCYGYSNVSPKDKLFYDSIIESFRLTIK